MILLIAKNTVQEGKQREFVALAKKMIENTRQEEGCIYYDLVADQNDEQVYFFIEKYKNEQAVEYHRSTDYFRTIVPQLGALRVKPSELSTGTVVE